MGKLFDNIGVTLGFTGEGPARRIVGLGVVALAGLLGAYLLLRKRK